MNAFIVTGTDTGIGKTVCAAMLTLGLGGVYWKPMQSGTEDGTDMDEVKRLTGLGDESFLPEKYIFTQPLSPHRAAELDKVEIDVDTLRVPESGKTLIIEGAGGLKVPVTREMLQIDLFKAWDVPVVLCVRTGLGTINHTLLSVEALRARDMEIQGLVFIGADNPDNIRTVADFAKVPVLGHIPVLDRPDRALLTDVFEKNFNKEDFV